MKTLRTNDKVEVQDPEVQRLSAGGLKPLATLIDHLRLYSGNCCRDYL
jgi:hypothetical protein